MSEANERKYKLFILHEKNSILILSLYITFAVQVYNNTGLIIMIETDLHLKYKD